MPDKNLLKPDSTEAITPNPEVNEEPPQAPMREYLEKCRHVIEQEQEQIKPILELCNTFRFHPKIDQHIDSLTEKDETTLTDLGTKIIAGIMGLKTYEAQMYTFHKAIYLLTFSLKRDQIKPETSRAMLESKLYMLKRSGRFNAKVAVAVPDKKVNLQDIVPALIKIDGEESSEWLEF